jgi:hypothetical protein
MKDISQTKDLIQILQRKNPVPEPSVIKSPLTIFYGDHNLFFQMREEIGVSLELSCIASI